MNRKSWGVLLAVVLGVVGTIVLVAYVRDAKDRAVAGEKLVDVLVASEPVTAGTAAEDLSSATKTERVPAKVRAEDAVTSLKAVAGLVTATDLVSGEQLLRSRFTEPGQVAKGVGEVKLPVGFVEITLSLEPQRAVGGLIRPGDKVAVFGSVDALTATSADNTTTTEAGTSLLEHGVLVTNVQFEDRPNEPARDETKTVAPTVDVLVTLGVNDATAENILFFAEHGKVWLGAEQKDAVATSSGAAP
jgi:pilus assembly protein CpaB